MIIPREIRHVDVFHIVDLVFQNDVVVRTAGTDNASIIILINMEKIAASKNVWLWIGIAEE